VAIAALALAGTPAVADHHPWTGDKFATTPRATSTGGVISSESALASAIGIAVLDGGGNAIDAAVAVTFAIGLTHPQMCGIGAGGFLVYRSADGTTAFLDFREAAPAAFNANTFNQGPSDGSPGAGTNLSRPGVHDEGFGHLTVGVPGVVAGMAAAHERFGSGKFALADLIAPTETMAREGFHVSWGTQVWTFLVYPSLFNYPETARVYGPSLFYGPSPYQNEGLQEPDQMVFKNPDLAASLRLIMTYGPDAFYVDQIYPEGPSIAHLIVADMEQAEEAAKTNPVLLAKTNGEPDDLGLMTAADLASYEAKWRDPIETTYRGHEVIGAGAPAAGVVVAETLNLLEARAVPNWSPYTVDQVHYTLEAQKLAWSDRLHYLADPDFETVPTKMLASQNYANKRVAEIGPDAKTLAEYGYGTRGKERPSTTGYSVIDGDGNAAAIVCSLNGAFGSLVTVPGTGMLLNGHMLDFTRTWPDGSPAPANAPEGGKRPRSSGSPTILVKDEVPILVGSGAGGASIPMGIVHSILGVVDWHWDIFHAVDSPRFDGVAADMWNISASTSCGLEQVVGEFARLPGAEPPFLAGQYVMTGPGELETALELRGHDVCDSFRDKAYVGIPYIHLVGTDLATGIHQAAGEPRQLDFGPDGQ
jgi:gamma-glutamyltranspeptidase / glutathione hydrolase